MWISETENESMCMRLKKKIHKEVKSKSNF